MSDYDNEEENDEYAELSESGEDEEFSDDLSAENYKAMMKKQEDNKKINKRRKH